MRVLFLTQIIPYPPDAGPRVKTWNVLNYLLDRGHRVTLASFIRDEEYPALPALRKVCEDMQVVPIHRSRIKDAAYWLRSNVSQRPFLVERDDLRGMRELVARLSASRAFDLVHADQLTMTQFALPLRMISPAPCLVFDAHNATWTVVERMKQNLPGLLRPIVSLESRRVKHYEGRVINQFDHTLAVTGIDRELLLQAAYETNPKIDPGKIQVIPIAVDAERLQPVWRGDGSFNILTLGTLRYPPNADGIRWFAQEVFPRILNEIPEARLTIIGKDPPQDFYAFSSRHPGSITITGYVPDIAPYLENAAIMVVPVRAGGGMRVRILEAFARGIPVVTTTIGMEGIDAEPDEDLLVADSCEEFASRTVQLLQDSDLQLRLGKNGRRLAEQTYDWKVVLQKLDTVYTENGSKGQ